MKPGFSRLLTRAAHIYEHRRNVVWDRLQVFDDQAADLRWDFVRIVGEPPEEECIELGGEGECASHTQFLTVL